MIRVIHYLLTYFIENEEKESDKEKRGLVDFYEDELNKQINEDIEELPTLEDEEENDSYYEEDEKKIPQSLPRNTAPITKSKKKITKKIKKKVPTKRKEKVKVKRDKKKKIKKTKKEVVPYRYPTMVEAQEAETEQDTDKILKENPVKFAPNPDGGIEGEETQEKTTIKKEGEESSSGEEESSSEESSSEDSSSEEIDYDDIMAETYQAPEEETKGRKNRRRRNKDEVPVDREKFQKGGAVLVEDGKKKRRRKKKNEEEQEEDSIWLDPEGGKKKRKRERRSSDVKFEHKVSNKILELQKRFGIEEEEKQKEKDQPEIVTGNLSSRFKEEDKMKIDMIKGEEDKKKEQSKSERRKRRREKNNDVVEAGGEEDNQGMNEQNNFEEKPESVEAEAEVVENYQPPEIKVTSNEEEVEEKENEGEVPKEKRKRRRKKNTEKEDSKENEVEEEVNPLENQEEKEEKPQKEEPKKRENSPPPGPSIKFDINTPQVIEVEGSDTEITVQEDVETEISVITEKEVETEVEVEVEETDKSLEENPLDNSKLDQLNMIEDINPDKTFIQPEQVVHKKGKKKIKRKKKKRTEPETFTKDLKVMDQIDFEEDNQTNLSTSLIGKRQLSEYEDCTDRDKNDIRDYIIKNREVKNPIVKSAEIDEILFRNVREREFKQMNSIQKILTILYSPIALLTYITIFPTSDSQKKYNKIRYLLCPIFGATFVFYVITNGRSKSLIFYLTAVAALAIVVTLLLFFILKPNEQPTGKVQTMITTLGLIATLAWIWFLTDILISIVKSLHIILNYHYCFMMIGAVSFLAWIPMALGSLKVVRLLQAMPGYSGVVFNGLFIFGISTLFQCIYYGSGRRIDVFPRGKSTEAVYLFIYIVVNFLVGVFSFFMLKSKGFRYSSLMGMCLALVYNGLVFYTFFEGMMSA